MVPEFLRAAAFAQDPVVDTTQKTGKSVSYEKVQWKVRPFPMKQVKLGECHPIACCTHFAPTPAFRPRRSRWADGKRPIASCADTTRADITFHLAL